MKSYQDRLERIVQAAQARLHMGIERNYQFALVEHHKFVLAKRYEVCGVTKVPPYPRMK